jgi:hypothetical protein
LYLHAWKEQCALFVHVKNIADVGSWSGVTDIGLMGLHKHGESVSPVVRYDRREYGMVGRVGVSQIW